MAKAQARSESDSPRRLPRGRHALAPEQVQADQRRRLIAAVPGAVAEHGYEAMSVADIVKRAAVSRNAFYNNFTDKQDCFAAALEISHERLLGTLTADCDPALSLEARVEGALRAALGSLAADANVARLLFVEAPSSAGPKIALRHHAWLRRYGELLRTAAPAAPAALAGPGLEEVIVGGIASRIASEVLEGRGDGLRVLTEPLANYVLVFCGGLLAGRQTPLVALDSDGALERREERPRRAGA